MEVEDILKIWREKKGGKGVLGLLKGFAFGGDWDCSLGGIDWVKAVI